MSEILSIIASKKCNSFGIELLVAKRKSCEYVQNGMFGYRGNGGKEAEFGGVLETNIMCIDVYILAEDWIGEGGMGE